MPDIKTTDDKQIADILDEGDKRVESDKKVEAKSFEDFAKKFSAKNFDLSGQKREPEQKQDHGEGDEGDEEGDEQQQDKPPEKRSAVEEHKKEPPFIRKQIERARTAETELEKTRKQLEKFEKEEKPKWESQISELQKKVDSGELTSVKQVEYEARIQKLEKEFSDKEQALVTENSAYKDRLKRIDLQEDDDFRNKYITPVEKSFGEVVKIIGGDEKKEKILHRALIANSSALNAKNEKDRADAEAERDELLTAIVENLPQFTQGRFTGYMTEYISSTQAHANALGDWKKTAESLSASRKAEIEKEQNKIIENWGRGYKVIGDEFTEDEKIPKELEDRLKDSNYVQELEENDSIARRVVTGRGSMNESIKIVHQGRLFPVMKAKISAQEAIIKELRQTIEKQRGSGTGSGETGNGERKQTMEDRADNFMKKYSANRPGLRTENR